MRIEFSGGTHEPVTWLDGTLSLGSAEGNDVRLAGRGVEARHARLTRDRRGLVLDVERGVGHVYVNARPVRERALLRAGDTFGLGEYRLRLCADALPGDASGVAVTPMDDDAVVALRAVAGSCSGRVWSLDEPLALMASGPIDTPHDGALTLTRQDGHILMDATALDDAVSVAVNGLSTRTAHLGNGDQLALGMHRYVLDVSACVETPNPPAEADVMAAQSAVTGARRSRREMGWLIATAVVLALLLAWALLAHY